MDPGIICGVPKDSSMLSRSISSSSDWNLHEEPNAHAKHLRCRQDVAWCRVRHIGRPPTSSRLWQWSSCCFGFLAERSLRDGDAAEKPGSWTIDRHARLFTLGPFPLDHRHRRRNDVVTDHPSRRTAPTAILFTCTSRFKVEIVLRSGGGSSHSRDSLKNADHIMTASFPALRVPAVWQGRSRWPPLPAAQQRRCRSHRA